MNAANGRSLAPANVWNLKASGFLLWPLVVVQRRRARLQQEDCQIVKHGKIIISFRKRYSPKKGYADD